MPRHTEFTHGRTRQRTQINQFGTLQYYIFIPSNRLRMQSGPRLWKRRGTLAQKKAKIGRPKLPKGEAKGRIVPVRFTADDLRAIAAQAKASKQNVSEWI